MNNHLGWFSNDIYLSRKRRVNGHSRWWTFPGPAGTPGWQPLPAAAAALLSCHISCQDTCPSTGTSLAQQLSPALGCPAHCSGHQQLPSPCSTLLFENLNRDWHCSWCQCALGMEGWSCSRPPVLRWETRVVLFWHSGWRAGNPVSELNWAVRSFQRESIYHFITNLKSIW